MIMVELQRRVAGAAQQAIYALDNTVYTVGKPGQILCKYARLDTHFYLLWRTNVASQPLGGCHTSSSWADKYIYVCIFSHCIFLYDG